MERVQSSKLPELLPKDLLPILESFADFTETMSIVGVGSAFRVGSEQRQSNFDFLVVTSGILIDLEAKSSLTEKLNGEYQILWEDDRLALHYEGTTLGFALYERTVLEDRLRLITTGLAVEPILKPWAVGGWIPEAFLADLSEAVVIYDRENYFLGIKELVSTYPKQLKESLMKFCIDGISHRLQFLKESKDITLCQVALSESILFFMRLIYASGEVYLRGIKAFEEDLGLLPERYQEIGSELLGIVDGLPYDIGSTAKLESILYNLTYL